MQSAILLFKGISPGHGWQHKHRRLCSHCEPANYQIFTGAEVYSTVPFGFILIPSRFSAFSLSIVTNSFNLSWKAWSNRAEVWYWIADLAVCWVRWSHLETWWDRGLQGESDFAQFPFYCGSNYCGKTTSLLNSLWAAREMHLHNSRYIKDKWCYIRCTLNVTCGAQVHVKCDWIHLISCSINIWACQRELIKTWGFSRACNKSWRCWKVKEGRLRYTNPEVSLKIGNNMQANLYTRSTFFVDCG